MKYSDKKSFYLADYLWKYSSGTNMWTRQYFVIDHSFIIRSYKNNSLIDDDDQMMSARQINNGTRVLPIPVLNLVINGKELFCIAIITSYKNSEVEDSKTSIRKYKSLKLGTDSQEDMEMWIKHIEAVSKLDQKEQSNNERLLSMETVKLTKKSVKAQTTKYYINDSTFWGFIYQADKSDIDRVYHELFTVPVYNPQGDKNESLPYDIQSNDDDILVVVYENQRYLPLIGWSSNFLLINDPAKHSSKAGVTFPGKSLKTTSAPSGYEWPEYLTEQIIVEKDNSTSKVDNSWKVVGG